MTIGSEMREARQRLRWTQQKLAIQAGITPSFVTKIEKYEVLPSADCLLTLAYGLVLDGDHLLSLLMEAKQARLTHRLKLHSRGRSTVRPTTPYRPDPSTSALPTSVVSPDQLIDSLPPHR